MTSGWKTDTQLQVVVIMGLQHEPVQWAVSLRCLVAVQAILGGISYYGSWPIQS